MTRKQIEARIKIMERRLAEVTHPQEIAAATRTLERLILLQANDENESE